MVHNCFSSLNISSDENPEIGQIWLKAQVEKGEGPSGEG